MSKLKVNNCKDKKALSEDIPNNLTSKKINKNNTPPFDTNHKFNEIINNKNMEFNIDETDFAKKRNY